MYAISAIYLSMASMPLCIINSLSACVTASSTNQMEMWLEQYSLTIF